MSGVLQTHAVKVTVYRRGKAPVVLGLASDGRRSDLLSVTVQRSLNAPALVNVVLPGFKGPEGNWWSDAISPGDWIQIDATIRRNPDALSDPWRTIFFGFVTYAGRNNSVSETELTRTSVISATCTLGFLQAESFNYWQGAFTNIPGAGEIQAAALNPTNGVVGQGGELLLYNTMAVAANNLMRQLIYAMFAVQRRIGQKDMLWRDTHGFRFDSDDFRINASVSQQFAQADVTFLDGLMGLLDAPVFYEFFVESAKIDILDAPQGSTRQIKPSGLVFPGQSGTRAEIIRLRPCPLPEFHKDGGYSAAAWNSLPTVVAREEVGEFALSVGRSLDGIYTTFQVYTAEILGGNGGDTQVLKAENAVVDLAKANDLRGRRPFNASTKRTTIRARGDTGLTNITDSATGQLSAASSGTKSGDVLQDVDSFLRYLSETAFSFHQYADRWYNGTIEGMGDLRIQLGSRYVNDGMMYYVEGYTHSFTPTDAHTALVVTRGLPLEVYRDEYPDHLGRKRADEAFAPVIGLINAKNGSIATRRKRGL